ncbi:MAG: DUF2269 domain-containing protein [Actinobacteria bacterium]|nr:DUF2269 domain-containing protein [Actinomycetota bacterium]
MYFRILLLIHIAGAIIGFGPAFAFGILGPLSKKLGGPQALGIMEGILALQNKLVIPIAAFFQPVSGVLLILEGGWAQNFFSHVWLWVALILYIVMFYLAVFRARPGVAAMIRLAKEGKAETPEFGKLAKQQQAIGPILGVTLLVIIFLMVMKPGG